ncbi:hypothetical protein HU200_065485 [Digitaria exilis]|uniref:Rx N-terminal domain-containing protein n=1 Tax=Digitaria exilis TaxID=1010633 RepID=A0A835DXE5_9POAL|nr:hypothetical protein HU200_065485 [Digitaria exilis]
MADLAAGAVGTLLGAIREETKLLGGVRGDLQFIKDEMESMKSFLHHLNKKKHRGREHDEPVRAWMNQVRELANDCSDCIDLYRTRDGLWRRHGWWIPSFVLEMVAQHRAANRLQELKARARDVGERRARYGVEVPNKKKGVPALLFDDDDEEEDEYGYFHRDDAPAVITEEEEPRGRRRPREFLEARPLEDYLSEKLVEWWTEKINGGDNNKNNGIGMPSIAIVAPPKDTEAVATAFDVVASLATRFEAMVCVNIPAMHPSHRRLQQPLDILLYMLLKLQEFQYVRVSYSPEVSNKVEEEQEQDSIRQGYYIKKKQELVDEMTKTVIEMKVNTGIARIKSRIRDIESMEELGLDMEGQSHSTQLLRLLLVALRLSPIYDWWGRILNRGEIRDKARSVSTISDDKEIIEKVARELGDEFGGYALCLHHTQCERILREVFFLSASSNTSRPSGGEEGNKIPDLDMATLGAQLTEKMDEMATKIEEQLEIKWTVDMIEEFLRTKRTLIILLDDQNYVCRWEETRDALSLLRCATDSAMMVITTKSIQEAKDFCHPPHKPIVYSLVDLYQYHDIVLKLITRHRQQHGNDEGDNYNTRIFHDILEKCHPHEFCMKMFAHALYANPNRRNEELRMLHGALVSSQKPLLDRNAEKMFMFSYNDLPKEYKSCLLYLAIFPQGQSIRRSTLVGRWITEGLLDYQDWANAVCQAERCFDGLIDRWLVLPVDIGAAGRVKSCMVSSQVHKFIIKIAKEEHIMETHLPHHLARHFSIFSDLRLRGSNSIEDFLQHLSRSSRLLLFKMLDLEDCQCFKKNRHYLKDICNNILLLKYLSLRGTNVTRLPKEINNLHDLEILDIRETRVQVNATSNILLRQLKRLLAGCVDTSPSNYETHTTSVRIPYRIDKMTNMEEDHLKCLVQAISELHECLRSLSITLHPEEEGATSSKEPIDTLYFQSPMLLESLGINGVTKRVQLLPLLVPKGSKELAKVTLGCTSLDQDSLTIIIAELPKLLSVRLRHKGYTQDRFTFRKNEFQTLNYFLVEGQNMTEITIEEGAAPELEKIVLSFTNISNLFGVERLPKLKEVELNGNKFLLSLFDRAHQIVKVTLRGTLLKEGDLHILAKKTNLRCLVLLDKSFKESRLNFKKDDFTKLNLLIINCSIMTSIDFSPGSAPWLRKIVWSFTKIDSLGIKNLRSLKELELNGEFIPNGVKDTIRDHKTTIDFKHNKPQNQDHERGHETEKGEDIERFPLFCWKSRG